MLSHNYQHWYTRLAGLTPSQWYLVLGGVGVAAGLSVIRPEFFRILVTSAARSVGRRILQLLRPQKTAGEGVTVAGEFVPDNARLRHTHIVGATGCGKTVLLEQLIYEDIARGHGALIIDPKGDRELYNRVKDFCRSIGREQDLRFLSASWPEESIRWNPCSIGNASELQSKWFNSGVYREPFYAKACELGLLEAFVALLEDKPEDFTISDLVRQLETQTENGKDKNVQGLYMDLQAFAKSEWGPILGLQQGVTGNRNRMVSLLDITSRNEILFVDLPTEAKAVQSARVGKLLLQELMLISGLRKLHPEIKSRKPFCVFIDEFDAFATENFVTFQNKGRSSDFMIHIAHQTLSDLDRVSPTFKGQVMGNCNVRFIFRQDDPDDAETWSRFLGTQTSVKGTFQTENGWGTGRSSNREVEEFKVHPNRIKDLGIGRCIFSMKTEKVMKDMKVPFPPKWPKRRVAKLERTGRGEEAPSPQSPSSFDQFTSERGSLLEEARKKSKRARTQISEETNPVG